MLFLAVTAAVGDLGLSVERARRLRPAVLLLADDSVSMGIPDGAKGQTRAERAQSALADLRDALHRRADVPAFRFGGECRRLPRPRDLRAMDPETDLAGAVRWAVEQAGKERVTGICILTDGQDTQGHTAAQIAESALGAPVFPVPIGSPEPPMDLEVSYVLAPQDVPRGEPVRVTADLRVGGRTSVQTTLVLKRGEAAVTRQRADLPPGSTRVDLETTPTQVGLARYTVRAEPVAGELTTQNNERTFFVRVVQGKRRVLWVDRPRQEFAAVRRAVERLEKLELDVYLKKEPTDGWWLERETPRKGARLPTRARLADCDAVVIGDLKARMLDASFTADVVHLTREKGIGTAVLTGSESLGPGGIADTAIGPVLLLDAAQVSYAPEPGRVTPKAAPGGPFGNLAAPWGEMPTLAGMGLAQSLRPGAQVLLEADVPGHGTMPLALLRRLGAGRTFVLLTDTTWRWARSEQATSESAGAHGEFWRALVWWLSTATGGKPVEVQLDRDVCTVGDTVRVMALVRDASFEPVADASVTATVRVPGGGDAEVACSPVGDSPGRYEGAFRVPAEGAYQVELQASRAGVSLGTAVAEFAAEPPVVEYRHPELNSGLLEEVARRTGGQIIEPGNASQGAAGIPTEGRTIRTRALWQPTRTWPFFLVFLLLAGLDWGLRRRWGLG